MNKIDISNYSCDKYLKRTHTNCSKDTTCKQGFVVFGKIRPDRRNEKKKIASNKDRTATKLDGEAIGDEAGDTNREYGPS